MNVFTFCGVRPKVHPSVYAFANVVVIGDVEIDAGVSLWPGVTIRGDKGTVRIGRGSNIQDHCMLHSDPDAPLIIGPDVTIGHGAIVHGCSVGAGCVIGIGAVLMSGVLIGNSSRVAAGAVVGAGPTYPPRSLLAGTPASIVVPLSDSDVKTLDETAAEYRALSEQYRSGLVRAHLDGGDVLPAD